jgi:hypothetical protein
MLRFKYSFILELLFCLSSGFAYASSQLFLFLTPSVNSVIVSDDNTCYEGRAPLTEGGSDSCASAPDSSTVGSSVYFGIGFYERLLIGLMITYLPVSDVETVAFETSLGLLLALKCLYYLFFSWSYWYLIIVSVLTVVILMTSRGRIVLSQMFYFAPLLGFGLFVSFCDYLKPTFLPRLPSFLVRKFMQLIIFPIVGKPSATSSASPEDEGEKKKSLMGRSGRMASFFHSSFFRNSCVITSLWISLGIFQAVVNFILIPVLVFLYSFMGYVAYMIGVLLTLIISVNIGTHCFGRSKSCWVFVLVVMTLVICFLFFY